MLFREINCKSALVSSRLTGIDYALNPYKGCEHNCSYCYAPSVLRIERKLWGSHIHIKKNMPAVLSKELKKKKPGTVGISTVTDPYQPVEKKYKLTRICLEQLQKADFPISIQTKSSLITRDIEIISTFSHPEVMVSIPTLNDDERKILEPFSASISNRLNVLKLFSEIGIKTSVFFGPIYPTIDDHDIAIIFDIFTEYGVQEIMIDYFRMKKGMWDNIILSLNKNKEFLNIFSNKISNNNNYYQILKQAAMDYSKKHKIKVIEAF